MNILKLINVRKKNVNEKEINNFLELLDSFNKQHGIETNKPLHVLNEGGIWFIRIKSSNKLVLIEECSYASSNKDIKCLWVDYEGDQFVVNIERNNGDLEKKILLSSDEFYDMKPR